MTLEKVFDMVCLETGRLPLPCRLFYDGGIGRDHVEIELTESHASCRNKIVHRNKTGYFILAKASDIKRVKYPIHVFSSPKVTIGKRVLEVGDKVTIRKNLHSIEVPWVENPSLTTDMVGYEGRTASITGVCNRNCYSLDCGYNWHINWLS